MPWRVTRRSDEVVRNAGLFLSNVPLVALAAFMGSLLGGRCALVRSTSSASWYSLHILSES